MSALSAPTGGTVRLSQQLDLVEDPQLRRQMEIASGYLENNQGRELAISQVDFNGIVADLRAPGHGNVTNLELAELNAQGFTALQNNVRESLEAAQGEIRAVGGLVAACHADNIAKLNMLQNSIEQVHRNVIALGGNVAQVSNALVALQNDFFAYIEVDARAKSLQRAETKLIGLQQELDSTFGHNKELRRTAVGMLEAGDMAAVRTETILSKAEELCLQTPGYWLAPALVTLAHWISASTGNTADSPEVRQALANTLNEAYKRDRGKTALFFGLICRRANLVSEANEWFKAYISFQRPEKVDQTCMVLLNAYAAGIMGHGEEEHEILATMSDWLEYLIADADGKHERRLIGDWRGTCAELVTKAKPSGVVYQALPEFAAETWPAMQQTLRATYLPRELNAFLERELSLKDFAEDDLAIIDNMISNLVSSYEGRELPIRREQQYQQLVIDLEGNERAASRLRSIKDGILSETKSFLDILSDAARDSSLSSASAATHVYAIKTQMKWIKKAYDEEVQAYHADTPQVIPFKVGDFSGRTQAGENEEEMVRAFVEHVNDQERRALADSKTGTLQKVALVGGIALFLISVISLFVSPGMLSLLGGLLGALAALWGWFKARGARNKQGKIAEKARQKRRYGVIVIRKLMQEVRQWRGEYQNNEAVGDALEALMTESIVDSEGVALGAFGSGN